MIKESFSVCSGKILILLLIFVFSGCATMIRGTSETLYINSEPEGATAILSTGQKCKTPCKVKLKRNQTVVIRFEKEGCEPEMVTVTPTLSGAGVLLGGIIDYGTGAVYSLKPNPVNVILKCGRKTIEKPVIKKQQTFVKEEQKKKEVKNMNKISDQKKSVAHVVQKRSGPALNQPVSKPPQKLKPVKIVTKPEKLYKQNRGSPETNVLKTFRKKRFASLFPSNFDMENSQVRVELLEVKNKIMKLEIQNKTRSIIMPMTIILNYNGKKYKIFGVETSIYPFARKEIKADLSSIWSDLKRKTYNSSRQTFGLELKYFIVDTGETGSVKGKIEK